MAAEAAARAVPPRRRAARRASLLGALAALAALALAAWPAPAAPSFAAGAAGGRRLAASAGAPSPVASPTARLAAKTAPAKTATAAALGDLGELTAAGLKAACKEAGLPTSGSKAALLEGYLGKLGRPELQAACRASGLKVGGKRGDLVARLVDEAQNQTARKAKAKAEAARARSPRARMMVARGTLAQTAGGLTKKDLVKNKGGMYVSKARSAASKESPWIKAVAKARNALGIKGFAVVGGKTKEGMALYKKAKSFM